LLEREEGPMKAQVSKWGNSLAIRLPKAAVASLQVREGEPVDLVIEGDTLLVRASRPHYALEQLVAEMRPEDQPEILDNVTSPPMGDELF
jgi:antitoxin MazE